MGSWLVMLRKKPYVGLRCASRKNSDQYYQEAVRFPTRKSQGFDLSVPISRRSRTLASGRALPDAYPPGNFDRQLTLAANSDCSVVSNTRMNRAFADSVLPDA